MKTYVTVSIEVRLYDKIDVMLASAGTYDFTHDDIFGDSNTIGGYNA